jgi:hypothetical protein
VKNTNIINALFFSQKKAWKHNKNGVYKNQLTNFLRMILWEENGGWILELGKVSMEGSG